MSRRTFTPRPPAEPPATTEAGAALERDDVVKLYDRQNGQGVDWRTIAGTLFKAGFEVLDKMTPEQRKPLLDRLHERSYIPATDDPGPVASNEAADPPGANAVPPEGQRPKPPR